MRYREVRQNDIAEMAEIRAADWGAKDYWRNRILQYLTHQLHPREARSPRVAFVGVDRVHIVGFIAGHLTHRFGCDGELEWISIRPQYRRCGIASQLLSRLAQWFAAHDARVICVDVNSSNQAARTFYAHHSAENLKPHWMVWQDIGAVLQVLGGESRARNAHRADHPRSRRGA